VDRSRSIEKIAVETFQKDLIGHGERYFLHAQKDKRREGR
jgi:hypothetical protein